MQEALANAARHAGGAAVRVAARRSAGRLLVSVVNEPPATPVREPLLPGNGITGMSERVALLGGEQSAGPTDGGGFAVRAGLPLGE